MRGEVGEIGFLCEPKGGRLTHSQAIGFHATQLRHLFEGAEHAPSSRGILEDGFLLCGKSTHQGRTGVFMHAQPHGAAFYVTSSRPQWPELPMCFLEVRAFKLRVVKGGMKERYYAPGEPGTIQRMVEILALWVLEVDVEVSTPAPTPAVGVARPAGPAPVFVSGSHAIVAWEYPAEEVGELGGVETGYLACVPGEEVAVLSAPENGHRGNLYASYVYAKKIEGEAQGWIPTLILHQPGYGEVALISGLTVREDLNGRSGRIRGVRGSGRMVVDLGDDEVFAIEESKLRIIDGNVEDFCHRRCLFRFHPDRGGNEAAFRLAYWLFSQYGHSSEK